MKNLKYVALSNAVLVKRVFKWFEPDVNLAEYLVNFPGKKIKELLIRDTGVVAAPGHVDLVVVTLDALQTMSLEQNVSGKKHEIKTCQDLTSSTSGLYLFSSTHIVKAGKGASFWGTIWLEKYVGSARYMLKHCAT